MFPIRDLVNNQWTIEFFRDKCIRRVQISFDTTVYYVTQSCLFVESMLLLFAESIRNYIDFPKLF